MYNNKDLFEYFKGQDISILLLAMHDPNFQFHTPQLFSSLTIWRCATRFDAARFLIQTINSQLSKKRWLFNIFLCVFTWSKEAIGDKNNSSKTRTLLHDLTVYTVNSFIAIDRRTKYTPIVDVQKSCMKHSKRKSYLNTNLSLPWLSLFSILKFKLIVH